jgi:hypothetical protein
MVEHGLRELQNKKMGILDLNQTGGSNRAKTKGMDRKSSPCNVGRLEG